MIPEYKIRTLTLKEKITHLFITGLNLHMILIANSRFVQLTATRVLSHFEAVILSARARLRMNYSRSVGK